MQAQGEVLVEEEQVLLEERGMVLAQVRPARVLAALAWVLDQGQARVKVEDLDPVAVRDRTATALAMEPAMTVLVRQMVQVMAQAMVPVRAGMDRAAAANNAKTIRSLERFPSPSPSMWGWMAG